ncbi:DUF302 domain-containing protein [Bdellovibrio sp.]|uniref:DUF302 domain-containing protein n=1 Tax=Bdellovibrio sp. TaxID=28201 RepID=UPI0039E26545
MSYSFNKTLNCTLSEAIEKVTEALKVEGFGILTDIDVQATLKAKINKDMPGYRILGACSPPLAFQAISAEPLIGTMLPCNVVVRELDAHKTEIAIIDPVASMLAVKNESLGQVAIEVQTKLKRVAEAL